MTDVIEYCAEHLPRWNFINVCGYHMREAGSTLVQEVAFALADAVTYVQAAVERGIAVDRFAPRFAFNFTAGTNLFEEAAKFRATRRLWARLMRERFGAEQPASWAFRTGAGSGASQLTAQQPENNLIRVTLNALAAILGGAQSLHTAAYDEALALPTEQSVKLALRTQQVLAHEAGLTEVIDPLAGSYYVEALTTEIEARARALMDEIERRGGVIAAIESGWTQQQIADASYERQRQIEAGERVIVGVNRFVEEEPLHVDIHRHLEAVAAEQAAALGALREERDARRVARTLDGLRAVAAERRQRHAATRRGGEGVRDDRRDLRNAARAVRGVSGGPGVLSARETRRPGHRRAPQGSSGDGACRGCGGLWPHLHGDHPRDGQAIREAPG